MRCSGEVVELKVSLAMNGDNRSKGVDEVVESMRAHSSDLKVQWRGLEALRNLAVSNGGNNIEIVAMGGIDDVQKAMRIHSSVVKVQRQGRANACIRCSGAAGRL